MNILFLDGKDQKTRETSDEQDQQKYIAEYKQIDCLFEMNDVSNKLFEVGLYIYFFIIQVENDNENSSYDQTENLHQIINFI